MLVLTRKCNESVVVGGTDGVKQVLRVTVLAMGGGQVRLGFEVDDEVSVHRSEVLARILAAGESGHRAPRDVARAPGMNA